MKILITGANGFIGNHLCKSLGNNHEVIGINRNEDLKLDTVVLEKIDIMDRKSLEQLFEKHSFDIVIHLAALTSHDDIINNKFKTLGLNISGTQNILDMFKKYCKDSLFVYSSTGKVYGKTDRIPISEASVTNPTNVLGKTKFITEKLIEFYANYNTSNKYVVLRIFNIFGERQKNNFIIPTILAQINKSSDITLGNIDDIRDYLYIKDLISAFSAVIHNYKSFPENIEYFNIGSGIGKTVNDILSVLEKLFNKNFNVKIDSSRLRQDETKIEYADISKFCTMTGWKPKFSLEEGLKLTLKEQLI